MQAAEAMILLIEDCTARTRRFHEALNDPELQGQVIDTVLEPIPDQDKIEQLEIAQAVCTAMLNAFIPVAKYRCFVQIDRADKKGHPTGQITAEFAVTSVSMAGIKSGLSALGSQDLDVHIGLFEQKPQGADMINGFQGRTKSQNYRLWYRGLDDIADLPTLPPTVQ
jgi:hypothetical protein